MPQHLTYELPPLSCGEPLHGRYQATKIGALTLTLNGKPWAEIPIYLNNPLPPPAGCPTCAKATSLMPDLSTRKN